LKPKLNNSRLTDSYYTIREMQHTWTVNNLRASGLGKGVGHNFGLSILKVVEVTSSPDTFTHVTSCCCLWSNPL